MAVPRDPSAAASVLVVDDHPIFRHGLVSLLSVEAWVGAVYEAADADEAVAAVRTRAVDVVSMDLRLGPRDRPLVGRPEDGLEATRAILQARPGTPVLVLTMVLEEGMVADALAAGARGYMLKSEPPEDVVDALHLVSRGGVVLGSEVGPQTLRHPREEAWPAPFDQLSPRERWLAQLVAAGRSNAGIARELGVSDKTVRNQLSALLVRLAVPDRVAVAILARERGLPPGPQPGAR